MKLNDTVELMLSIASNIKCSSPHRNNRNKTSASDNTRKDRNLNIWAAELDLWQSMYVLVYIFCRTMTETVSC